MADTTTGASAAREVPATPPTELVTAETAPMSQDSPSCAPPAAGGGNGAHPLHADSAEERGHENDENVEDGANEGDPFLGSGGSDRLPVVFDGELPDIRVKQCVVKMKKAARNVEVDARQLSERVFFKFQKDHAAAEEDFRRAMTRMSRKAGRCCLNPMTVTLLWLGGCLGIVLLTIALVQLKGIENYVVDECVVDEIRPLEGTVNCDLVVTSPFCEMTTILSALANTLPIPCTTAEADYAVGSNMTCYTPIACPKRAKVAGREPITPEDAAANTYAFLADPDDPVWTPPSASDWYLLGPALGLLPLLWCAWTLMLKLMQRIDTKRALPY